jgi:hypothetical protein
VTIVCRRPFEPPTENKPVRRQRRAAAMAIARRATPEGRGAQRRVIRPGDTEYQLLTPLN